MSEHRYKLEDETCCEERLTAPFTINHKRLSHASYTASKFCFMHINREESPYHSPFGLLELRRVV